MDNEQKTDSGYFKPKIRKSMRKGISPTEEARKNISKGLANYKLPVVIDGIHYESIAAAATALNMYSTKVSTRVRSHQPRWATWTWAPKNTQTN